MWQRDEEIWLANFYRFLLLTIFVRHKKIKFDSCLDLPIRSKNGHFWQKKSAFGVKIWLDYISFRSSFLTLNAA